MANPIVGDNVADPPRIVIVGAGPAGVRAAETLVQAGVRPIVIDEAQTSGGQIYRRQPAVFKRGYAAQYGLDAQNARTLHGRFDRLIPAIDYRPDTLAWNLYGRDLHTISGEMTGNLTFDALILATGATDRLLPVKGWTLPGCYSMGAAQIALKAQACAIGRRVVFMGTGPLLYLVSYQYAKAGVDVAAVLDTSAFSGQIRALPLMASRPDVLAKGLYYRALLTLKGIPVFNSITPLQITGEQSVSGVAFTDANGRKHNLTCDAVGMGFHLRSETQLADLARCHFSFDADLGQWRPDLDQDGRATTPGIYVAGDGAKVLGADAAEISGQLAALATLTDMGHAIDTVHLDTLRKKHRRMETFRRGLALAFPWPAHLARQVADDVLLCRCEAITAGDLRHTVAQTNAPELNRAKAMVRVGMGRCQGRFCASAAAEIMADARNEPLSAVGRLRGQGPVKPLPMTTHNEVAS